MNFEGQMTDTIRQYMESATITQALIIIAGLIIVVLFIVWVFNRLFNALQKQIENQQHQISQQQRQLDISEKNAETGAKNAESFRRSTNALEELTDQMRSSNTAIAVATKGIGDLGAAQSGTNELVTSTSLKAVTEIVSELGRVEKLFQQFFDASRTPDSPIYAALQDSLKPEFAKITRSLDELKLLMPPVVIAPPAPAPAPLEVKASISLQAPELPPPEPVVSLVENELTVNIDKDKPQ